MIEYATPNSTSINILSLESGSGLGKQYEYLRGNSYILLVTGDPEVPTSPDPEPASTIDPFDIQRISLGNSESEHAMNAITLTISVHSTTLS